MVEIFTIGYYIWVITAVVLFFIVYFLTKDKSDRFKFNFLVLLAISTWVLHFLRIWLDPEMKTHHIFFEDFCGFNTLMLPFLLLHKSKLSKSFMFFNGALFALHSLLYPNNIVGDPYLSYNTIRFFFAHFLLISIPLWMILYKMYIPNLKEVPYNFIYLLVGAMYCFSLSVIIKETGILHYYKNYMGLWGDSESVYLLSEKLAPMLRYKINIDGETVSKPIPYLYMLPTLIIVYVPVWIFMALPFHKKKVKIS